MNDFSPSAPELFKALKGKGKPHDFMCSCPAHHDRTPSLHVTREERPSAVLLPRRVPPRGSDRCDAWSPAVAREEQWISPKWRNHRPVEPRPELEVVTPDELKPAPILPAPTVDDVRVQHYRREVITTTNVVHDFVYYQGGVPVFIKQRMKSGQKFTPHWRVEDDAGELWQNIAPADFKKLPYVSSGRDPFKADGAETRSLFWCEGEKDVDTLAKLGLDAFTFGSAGHIPTGAALYIEGRKVVIPVDNDDAGRRDAEAKARCCLGHAASIKVIEFPELPEKGDVSDWLVSHSRDELRQMVLQTPEWQPSEQAAEGTDRPSARADHPRASAWK